jgi:hypothetical protein
MSLTVKRIETGSPQPQLEAAWALARMVVQSGLAGQASPGRAVEADDPTIGRVEVAAANLELVPTNVFHRTMAAESRFIVIGELQTTDRHGQRLPSRLATRITVMWAYRHHRPGL